MKLSRGVFIFWLVILSCGSVHPITTVEHTDLKSGENGVRFNEFPAPVVEAVGWKNLANAETSNVGEEFQIAIYSNNKPFHLFRISSSKKQPGETILFWPFDGSSDSAIPDKNMQEYLAGICEEFERAGPYEFCVPEFSKNNDWGKIYSNLELRNIWTLPNGADISSNNQNKADSFWGLAFQIRKDMLYRTYSYQNPDLYNNTPEALDVLAIAAQLRLIANNFTPPQNYNTYSGITNGLKGSDFKPCGVNEKWRFNATLTDLISKKGMSTIIEQQNDLLFQVKVAGTLRDEWYSNRRSTGFTKIITPIEVSEVSVVSDTICMAQ